MLNKIVFATKNKNKLAEVAGLLNHAGITVCGVEGEFNPEETGNTFAQNAYIKAYAAAKLTGEAAFGDDSGLVVDALDGRPGIYSSRYADSDGSRINKLLRELTAVPHEKRTARFVCAMSVVSSSGEELFACEGICEGFIGESASGEHGFGYDPIFYVSETNSTMAELTMDEKNNLSHRGKAIKQLINWAVKQ